MHIHNFSVKVPSPCRNIKTGNIKWLVFQTPPPPPPLLTSPLLPLNDDIIGRKSRSHRLIPFTSSQTPFSSSFLTQLPTRYRSCPGFFSSRKEGRYLVSALTSLSLLCGYYVTLSYPSFFPRFLNNTVLFTCKGEIVDSNVLNRLHIAFTTRAAPSKWILNPLIFRLLWCVREKVLSDLV